VSLDGSTQDCSVDQRLDVDLKQVSGRILPNKGLHTGKSARRGGEILGAGLISGALHKNAHCIRLRPDGFTS
jgi:hypothetical protein